MGYRPARRERPLTETEAALSPTLFAHYASYGEYVIKPHLELIDDAYLRCAVEGGQRVMIWMPPRHGKSETTSKYGPPWFLGQCPDARLMLCSYASDFAQGWGLKSRVVFQENAEAVFGGLRVDTARQKMDDWGIAGHDGGMTTAGVGGVMTGKGADVMIIDDPVKDYEQALSETYRQRAKDWFRSTARTRIEPGGSIIIVQTRWHEDDLSGWLLTEQGNASEGGTWTVLVLLAVAEDGDALGRQPGEALWPMRYSAQDLATLRDELGTYWFEALYQQRPSPAEGGMFKRHWWRYYESLPEDWREHGTCICSWDMTFKKTTAGSWVVGQVWMRYDREYYLLDQVRVRAGFVETRDALLSLDSKWPEISLHVVEEKANGDAVIDALRASGKVSITGEGVSVSKEARAAAVSGLVEGGAVRLPSPSVEHSLGSDPFVAMFKHEAAQFPNGAHDDQVDGMSQALNRLRVQRAGKMRSPLR